MWQSEDCGKVEECGRAKTVVRWKLRQERRRWQGGSGGSVQVGG